MTNDRLIELRNIALSFHQAELLEVLAEVEKLQSELTALKTLANLPPDYCLSCGGDGGHLEGCQGTTGLMSVLTELNEANARISCLTIANKKLHKELAALRTPHRCCDCENYHPLTRNCYGATGVRVESCKVPWLCGHFKAKGTQ